MLLQKIKVNQGPLYRLDSFPLNVAAHQNGYQEGEVHILQPSIYPKTGIHYSFVILAPHLPGADLQQISNGFDGFTYIRSGNIDLRIRMGTT